MVTAGSGVLHSEMPEQEQGLLHGFQIWLNLPAAEKMKPAAYQEFANTDIPEQAIPGGGVVRVIAGKVLVNEQPMLGMLPDISTQPVLLDVQLEPNEAVELSFNVENPALAYVYQGGTDVITLRQMGIYRRGKVLQLQAGSSGAGLLVLSGRQINEPLVQYGPFVMNSSEEIERALNDFQDPEFLDKLTANREVSSMHPVIES
ncbi:MAG: redox-sensitive bicupin YhaK (pirin superfamily) [Halioglobus sp.]|jgi:redox-sensitive bicupin YhaK (pirin superfamily)